MRFGGHSLITKFTGDKIFKTLTAVIATVALLILLLTATALINGSSPVFRQFGIQFIFGTQWNPGAEIFNILPYILGTLVTSAIALLVGVPLSLGIAIFLAEMSPRAISAPIGYIVELLAAVPSVIYGLWGIYVFRSWVLKYFEIPVSNALGWLPIFSGNPQGQDLLTASLILAIMIIPTISSISREILTAVPNSIREAAYSIGATKWEVIKIWVLNYGRSGIFGAVILGLGRAVGETMAVAMLIGNAVGPEAVPHSLFAPSQTMASLIANGWLEAGAGSLESSAYLGTGLVLLAISLLINIAAQVMVTRVLKVKGGAIE